MTAARYAASARLSVRPLARAAEYVLPWLVTAIAPPPPWRLTAFVPRTTPDACPVLFNGERAQAGQRKSAPLNVSAYFRSLIGPLTTIGLLIVSPFAASNVVPPVRVTIPPNRQCRVFGTRRQIASNKKKTRVFKHQGLRPCNLFPEAPNVPALVCATAREPPPGSARRRSCHRFCDGMVSRRSRPWRH